MAVVSTIALADGKTTPVTHTFNIQQQNSAGAILLENRVGGVPLGYENLELFSRERKPNQLGTKVKATLRLPTLDTSGTSPVLSHVDLAEVTFVCSEKSSVQGRDDLVTMLRNSLADGGVIHTTVMNGEGIWT